MAKAKITTDSGATVELEGSPEEIAKIMGLYNKTELVKQAVDSNVAEPEKISSANRKFSKMKTANPTMTDSIKELIVNGFFDKPRGLADIKNKLEEYGVFIAITSLSERALFLTKKRDLRRIKDSKTSRWCYVKK